MSLLATITSQGMLKALQAGAPGGPQIDITSFRIGSVAAFTPADSLTNVVGPVYQGASYQISYFVQDSGTVRFRIKLDSSIGDFTIGNIGLFLADGTMFAIAALPGPTTKLKDNFPTQAGNTRTYDIILRYSSLSTLLTFSISQADYQDLPTVEEENDLPPVLSAPHSVYVVQYHTQFQTPVFAYLNVDEWVYSPISNSIPIYTVQYLDDLRALAIRPIMVNVLFGETLGDNLGGFFYWKAGDTSTPNNYDIIEPDAPPAGRWLRMTGFTRWRIINTGGHQVSGGEKVIVDTTSSAFSLTLPIAPLDGMSVDFICPNNSWTTNNLTINRNGKTIGGSASNLICDITVSFSLVFYSNDWKIK